MRVKSAGVALAAQGDHLVQVQHRAGPKATSRLGFTHCGPRPPVLPAAHVPVHVPCCWKCSLIRVAAGPWQPGHAVPASVSSGRVFLQGRSYLRYTENHLGECSSHESTGGSCSVFLMCPGDADAAGLV